LQLGPDAPAAIRPADALHFATEYCAAPLGPAASASTAAPIAITPAHAINPLNILRPLIVVVG
jgi:hypothetical protein